MDGVDDDDYWASKKRSLDRQARTQSASFNSMSSRYRKESLHSQQSPSNNQSTASRHHVALDIPVLQERQERVPSYSDNEEEEEKMEVEISPQSTATIDSCKSAKSPESPENVQKKSISHAKPSDFDEIEIEPVDPLKMN